MKPGLHGTGRAWGQRSTSSNKGSRHHPPSRFVPNQPNICATLQKWQWHACRARIVHDVLGAGGRMTDQMRVMLEIGPRGKKVVAVAPDWPGLERGGKTGEAAIERLLSYLPRYGQVAMLAGMDAEFAARNTTIDVVEHYPGNGSTDFWGI